MKPALLTQEERLNWLRLIRSENVGPVTFHHLLQSYGSATNAIEQLREHEPELAFAPKQWVAKESEVSDDTGRERLISLIGSAPTAIDDLTAQSHLPLPQILLLLVELELAGQISREPAQRVVRLEAQD